MINNQDFWAKSYPQKFHEIWASFRNPDIHTYIYDNNETKEINAKPLIWESHIKIFEWILLVKEILLSWKVLQREFIDNITQQLMRLLSTYSSVESNFFSHYPSRREAAEKYGIESQEYLKISSFRDRCEMLIVRVEELWSRIQLLLFGYWDFLADPKVKDIWKGSEYYNREVDIFLKKIWIIEEELISTWSAIECERALWETELFPLVAIPWDSKVV